MDKEYLSLMAELGEAPVPASVGSTSGPATTPLASAPRPAAPANNPPPPVSFRGWFSKPGPLFSSREMGRDQVLGEGQVDMAGNTVLPGHQECLGTSQLGNVLAVCPGPVAQPKEQCCRQRGQAGTLAGMLSRSLSCPLPRAAHPG